MHFRPSTTTTTTFSLYTTIFRYISTSTKLTNLSKIPSKYRPQAIQQAQQALTDYLHNTRSLPFTYAEHISKNSTFSLSYLIARVDFKPPSMFLRSFQRFLRYHPINEFEFFYESIGIDYDEINGFLPANMFFLSEDSRVLNAACALSGFGFPWNRLGNLYKEDISVFGQEQKELIGKLCGFKDYGFSNATIIGVCLVFPCVLSGKCELGGEISALFDDLKRVFIDFDLASCVEENVDDWYKVCRKIRVFYDLGCEKGQMGELMGRNKNIFLEYTEEVLIKKAGFFCRLDVRKGEIGLLLLERPEILEFDLENPTISVLGFLKHFEMNPKELKSVAQKYPYVIGRNKMVNLPHVIKAMDLQEWFFDKMKNGSHYLFRSYAIRDPDEDLDSVFKSNLETIQSSRTPIHTLSKLNFLHGIGYGENSLTIKVLTHLHGTSTELQERFDCLLRSGIDFSRLCKMVSLSPKILNQKSEILEQKMIFLCNELGSSLQYLDVFPAFLCYDLEKRIKPRYSFHVWLIEKGLSSKEYSLASMIATSEKNFMARIYGIHPAALKQWFEFVKQKSK